MIFLKEDNGKMVILFNNNNNNKREYFLQNFEKRNLYIYITKPQQIGTYR